MVNLLPVVFIYADNADHLASLTGMARQWSERVHLLFIGDAAEASAYAGSGVDVIHHFTPQENIIAEDYTPSFARLIRQTGERALVLMGATKRCKAVAARLGAKLHAAVANDISELRIEGEAVFVSQCLYGGLAVAQVSLNSAYLIMTVGDREHEAPVTTGNAVLRSADFIAPERPVRLLSRKPKQGEQTDYGKAKYVVGVGRGFGARQDLAMAQALAQAIQGEMCCSRPVAEGAGWMDRQRYIGVSGISLSADVYIAIGISGQIQHRVGVNGVKTILAINKDKNAPIFAFTDYGIVGDLYRILPVLTQKLAG